MILHVELIFVITNAHMLAHVFTVKILFLFAKFKPAIYNVYSILFINNFFYFQNKSLTTLLFWISSQRVGKMAHASEGKRLLNFLLFFLMFIMGRLCRSFSNMLCLQNSLFYQHSVQNLQVD